MNLNITEKEMAILLRSVEMYNDMMQDCLYDDVESLNFFPKDGEKCCITKENASKIREELNEAIKIRLALVALITKLGGAVNEDGYSV